MFVQMYMLGSACHKSQSTDLCRMCSFRATPSLSLLCLLLAGCATGTVLGPVQTVLVPPLPSAAAAPLPESQAENVAARHIRVFPSHLDPASDLHRHRSVFFDFDGWSLRQQDEQVVEMHGIYLWRYPELRVRVEGNTDDRGSREYNLALGERRAQAVKEALHLLGARDEQIEAVSYGEEKPRHPGHDERSRALNRRADIVYRAASR